MKPAFRKATLAFLVLFSLSLLAGCGSDDSNESSSEGGGLPKEIVIGAAIAKTGILAPYDASVAAVEQLVDETNAKGGIEGHKLRMVQADTRSDPQQAVVAAEQVIEEGADVMLVTCEALTGDAEAAVAEEHDMLNFTLCENEPGFGPPTGSHLSFSANPSLLSEASAGATFLHEKGIERPFLFRDIAYVYGKAYCSAFQQTWEHLGGTVAGSVDFKNDRRVGRQPGQRAEELRRRCGNHVLATRQAAPPRSSRFARRASTSRSSAPSAFDGTFWLKGISNTEDIYATSNGSIYDPPNQATTKLFENLEARRHRNRRLHQSSWPPTRRGS